MVDACMRALLVTGWINFRMRVIKIIRKTKYGSENIFIPTL